MLGTLETIFGAKMHYSFGRAFLMGGVSWWNIQVSLSNLTLCSSISLKLFVKINVFDFPSILLTLFGSPKVAKKIKLTQLCCPWVYLICCLQIVHNVWFLRIETGHVALSDLFECDKLTMEISTCFRYFLSRIFGSLDCLNIKDRCVAKTTEV